MRRPLTLLIKPAAGLCDLKCRYCFYRAQSAGRANEVMTQSTAMALLEKLAVLRPASLHVVFQGGEPTLAGLGFLRSFVKALEALPCPLTLSLQTNGQTLDDDWAGFLSAHRFTVGLSLDGDKTANDRYRRTPCGGSAFEKTLAAAALLQKHGIDFSILAVLDDKNAAEIANTYRFFRSRGFARLQFIPCIDEGSGISLSPAAYGQALKTLFDLWEADLLNGEAVSVRLFDNWLAILLGQPPESCANGGVCGAYTVVKADGSLYPCDFYCTDACRLGSVFDPDPFGENAVRRAFYRDSLRVRETCAACEWGFLCRGGCRRDRTDDLTQNRYCAAYRDFFAYAFERMRSLSLRLSGGERTQPKELNR